MTTTKLRPLLASEVTFTTEIEPEDLEVRGNCMCSDDPEFDKQCEDEILERLDRGYIEAWCCVVVKATWEAPDGTTLEGVATLGGCSFGDGYGAKECVDEHGMKDEALDDLNYNIQRSADNALKLIEALRSE